MPHDPELPLDTGNIDGWSRSVVAGAKRTVVPHLPKRKSEMLSPDLDPTPRPVLVGGDPRTYPQAGQWRWTSGGLFAPCGKDSEDGVFHLQPFRHHLLIITLGPVFDPDCLFRDIHSSRARLSDHVRLIKGRPREPGFPTRRKGEGRGPSTSELGGRGAKRCRRACSGRQSEPEFGAPVLESAMHCSGGHIDGRQFPECESVSGARRNVFRGTWADPE